MPIEIKSRKKLDEALKEAVQWIEDIEESRKNTDKVAMELYKNYNSIRSKRFYNGDSDIFVPFSFMMVETMVAKIMRSVWSEPIPVPIAGVGPNDKDQADKIRALLHMQQKSQVKLWTKMLNYWRAKCIYPRAYAEIFWRTDYRKVRKPKVTKTTAEQGPVEEGAIDKPSFSKVTSEETMVAEYDCWDVKNLDYFDVGVDPTTPDGDIQRAKFTYVRSLVTDQELKIMADQKDKDDRPLYEMVKEVKGAGDGKFSDDYLDQKSLLGIDLRNLPTLENKGDRHEMHTCYMHYDIDDDGVIEKDCLVVILDRKQVIRFEKNPWWHGKKPYISGSYFERPNQFEGMSLIQPVRKIQYEINDKRNQELDSATYSLLHNWLVGADAGIEDSQIRVSQGGVIHADDITQVREVTFPDLTQVGQRAEAILEANMREAIGVTRSVQGVQESGPRQTATQFSQMLAQAGDRTRLTLETFGNNEWASLWSMAHSLNQQHLRQDTFVRLTERDSLGFDYFGEDNLTGELDDETGLPEIETTMGQGTVSEADLAMDMDFIVQSFGELEMENLRNANLTTFMQLVSTLPPDEQNKTFFNMIIRKYWTGVMKMPLEELIDDNGEFIMLTQPGAKSIFDAQIAEDRAQSDAQLQPQDPTAEEVGPLGGAVPGGFDPQDLAELENIIPTGGNQ